MKKLKMMKLPFLIIGVSLGISISLRGNGSEKSQAKDNIKETNPWEFALEINLNFNQPQARKNELAEKSDFIQQGLVKKKYSEMTGFISSVPKGQKTFDGFTSLIKTSFYQSSFSEKLGILA